MIKNKNKELSRLEKIYEKNVINAGVKLFKGEASLLSRNQVKINNEIIKANDIILATGGTPLNLKVPGVEYT